MSVYVLVHGSWHDGSLLEPVAAELRSLGHEVHTPTVAGHGSGAELSVTHHDGVDSIVQYYLEHDLADTVLVGHSFGGTIIARVSEELPNRVARLVFWSAFVPAAGRSIAEEVAGGAAAEGASADIITKAGDATSSVPSFDVWQRSFIQDATDEVARATYALLTPEPAKPKFERLDLTRFYASAMPKSYIELTEDRALPGPLDAEAMAKRMPDARRLRVSGSHEILFTDPQRIARAIADAGRSDGDAA